MKKLFIGIISSFVMAMSFNSFADDVQPWLYSKDDSSPSKAMFYIPAGDGTLYMTCNSDTQHTLFAYEGGDNRYTGGQVEGVQYVENNQVVDEVKFDDSYETMKFFLFLDNHQGKPINLILSNKTVSFIGGGVEDLQSKGRICVNTKIG